MKKEKEKKCDFRRNYKRKGKKEKKENKAYLSIIQKSEKKFKYNQISPVEDKNDESLSQGDILTIVLIILIII